MKEYLRKLPKEIKVLISRAAQVARDNGVKAYLVGGFVRDLLLGVKNLDLDIVVEADGIKFARDFYAKLPKAKLICHTRFGTATIISYNLKIDIATARSEFYPHPASLPVVKPGLLKDDLARRDFTINAMAMGIGMKDVRLIDFFSAKSDLSCGKIRVLHKKSFIDDPTRILRAVRFEKRYNFEIEPHTLRWLKEAVKLKMLDKTEPQRLRDELVPLLKEKNVIAQIKRLYDLTKLKFISQGLTNFENTLYLLRKAEKEINWFKRNYAKRRQLDSWLIYFAILLDSLNIKQAKAACSKFVFRKGEEKRMISFKAIASGIISELSQKNIKAPRIYQLLEPLSYETILLIKVKANNGWVDEYIEDFFEIYNGMRIFITGHDLHKMQLTPGPHYQKIFTKVLHAKLEGLVRTRNQELTLIRKLIKTL